MLGDGACFCSTGTGTLQIKCIIIIIINKYRIYSNPMFQCCEPAVFIFFFGSKSQLLFSKHNFITSTT